MTTQPFWMIHCAEGHAPTFRHPTFDSAKTEARRLARLHPDQEFVVLEAVLSAVKRDVELRVIRKPPRADSDGGSVGDYGPWTSSGRPPDRSSPGPADVDDEMPF